MVRRKSGFNLTKNNLNLSNIFGKVVEEKFNNNIEKPCFHCACILSGFFREVNEHNYESSFKQAKTKTHTRIKKNKQKNNQHKKPKQF